MRLAIFAVSRPIAGSEKDFRSLSEAGAGLARVHRLQREQPRRDTNMPARRKRRGAKRKNRGNLGLDTLVIGEIEVKRDGSCYRGARYQIEPNHFFPVLDQKMLGI